jgi:uncharacterized membrane protein
MRIGASIAATPTATRRSAQAPFVAAPALQRPPAAHRSPHSPETRPAGSPYHARIGRESASARVERQGRAAVEALRTWFVWILLAALSPGWTVWLLTRDELGPYLRENRLVGASPSDAWPYLLGSMVSMMAVLTLWVRMRRRRRPDARVHELLHDAARGLRPLLILPVLPLLFDIDEGIQSLTRPALIALVVLLVAAGVHAWRWPSRWRPRLTAKTARSLSLAVVAFATLAWVVYFARLGWMRHWSLNTRAFDLGIYDNIFWNTINGDPLACSIIKGGTHLSAHFDPLLVLLAPAYGLSPRAETLITLQVVWIATGVIPLYRLSMRRLGSRAFSTILCLCYLLHPSLQGIVLFEFHSLALIIPLSIWAIERLDAGAIRGYFVALAGILLAREDAALFACGLGLWAMVHPPGRIRVGLATLGICVAWLAFVKLVVMPDSGLLMANSEGTYTYANRFADVIPDGEGGVRDILLTLVTNPMFVLQYVLQADKIVALVVLLLPLCFLPLLAGTMRVTFLYGFTFILLASKPSIYYPYFHYVSVLVPVLIAAVPAGVQGLLRRARVDGIRSPLGRASMAALLSSSILCSLEYGAIVENETFRLHTEVVRELTEAEREQLAWLRETIDTIPDDRGVSASNRIAPHVTNRDKIHLVQQRIDTKYVLVHKGDLSPEQLQRLRNKLDRGTHSVVDTHGVMMLIERDPV